MTEHCSQDNLSQLKWKVFEVRDKECNMKSNHFTKDNITLLNALAKAIGIPNIHLEIEDGENEKDTLVIEYSEYITYVPEDETYTPGHIVHFPGSRDEPPDDDFKDRGEYDNFDQAVYDVILHITIEKINQALEFHWFSSLPSDPPGCPVCDLGEESTLMYGFEEVEA